MTVNDILEYINSVKISDYEYNIISSLLDTCDDRLFLKILEEIINGNLYWSDFERNLSYTEYPTVLNDQMKQQKELREYIGKLIRFRQKFNSNYYIDSKSLNAIIENPQDGDEFFSKEYNKIRDSVIYEIVKPNPNDNAISSAYKIRLYNMILNGDIVLKNNYPVNNDGTVSVDNETYEYISPNDIFMFLDSFIIPINYKYQTLDAFDKIYMKSHNIKEDQMKQMKALSIVLRRGTF